MLFYSSSLSFYMVNLLNTMNIFYAVRSIREYQSNVAETYYIGGYRML